jgi:hypothetical protein
MAADPVWWLAALGVALRVRQWAAGRSLWLDEAQLANGVVEQTAYELLTQPLPANQVAPIGTVLLMRAAVVAFGPTDWAVRLVPLAGGIALVVAAAWLAQTMIRSLAGRVCLVGLTACSPALVYYAAEAKQYGLDAAVTLGVVAAAVTAGGGLVPLACLGVVAPWLSHTAPFALAAVGVVRLGGALRERRRAQVWALAAVGAVCLVSTALAYGVTLRSVRGNLTMGPYWRAAFAPTSFEAATAAWYANALQDLVAMAFKRAGPSAPAPGLLWPSWLDLAVPVAAGAGVLAMLRRHPRRGLVVVLTLGAALGASAAGLYPLQGRLLLFAVPLTFVALAMLVEAVASRPGRWRRAGSWALSLALLALVAAPAARIARRPLGGADVKGALAYVQAHRRPRDRLAVSAWSLPAVRFYRAQLNLGPFRPAPRVPHSFDATAFLREVRRTQSTGRTWVVFSHRIAQRRDFVRGMRPVATPLDAWEGDGAAAYLFVLPARP